jgi:tRNA threonylcarbamoyladenosine biosynthesis protein TsaE
MTLQLLSTSPDDTLALAERVGALLRPGDVVVLSGELGTGKTVFAKGLARALGVTDPVVSPTFTIVHEYAGVVPFVHVDVYRIDRLQELHDLGFDDLLGADAVTVVEWGDRVGSLLPTDRLAVALELGDAPNTRVVEIEAVGSGWTLRRDALRAVTDAP